MEKEDTWGKNAIEHVKLSPEQTHKLYDEVIKAGRKRQVYRVLKDEFDFFCGALAVFNALDIAPPTWIFKLFTGESVLEEKELD